MLKEAILIIFLTIGRLSVAKRVELVQCQGAVHKRLEFVVEFVRHLAGHHYHIVADTVAQYAIHIWHNHLECEEAVG